MRCAVAETATKTDNLMKIRNRGFQAVYRHLRMARRPYIIMFTFIVYILNAEGNAQIFMKP
jgi:hypothetical protein